MLKVLIKARFSYLAASLGNTFGGAKSKGKRKNTLIAVLLLLLIAVVGVYNVGYIFWGICDTLCKVGLAPFAVVIAILFAALACIIGSIFAVKSQIFESGDNELLLSMPIPPKAIFISRMIVLLVLNYAIEFLVLLPCGVIYGIVWGFAPLGLVFFVGVLLLLPLLTLALSTFIAWIISEITSRLRHKTVVTVVLFALFMVGYMYLTFTMSGMIENDGVIDLSALENTLVFWWAADAVSNAGALSFLYFFLFCVGFALVAFVALDKSFLRIVTTKKTPFKVEYKEREVKAHSGFYALVKKELLRFFTSATYIMNTAIGAVMGLVGAVALVINANVLKEAVLALEISHIVPLLVLAICALCSSMCYVSAPSVSLEDRQLWILHSFPVSARTVLLAKLSAHLIICLPLIIVSLLVLCIAFGIGFGMSLLLLIGIVVLTLLYDYFGLLVGLKFPKFGWKTEVEPIKQGACSLIAMLGSMMYTVGMCFIGYKCVSVSVYLALGAVTGISVALTVALHVCVMKYGTKMLENLRK